MCQFYTRPFVRCFLGPESIEASWELVGKVVIFLIRKLMVRFLFLITQ